MGLESLVTHSLTTQILVLFFLFYNITLNYKVVRIR